MGEGGWLVLFIAAERIVELAIARKNAAELMSEGAVEYGREQYPFIVATHAAWLGGLWLLGREHDVSLILLGVFAALQLFRVWIISSLGRRWTTRIIVLHGAPLCMRGPYRFLRHPNYVVVVLEIAVVPLALGLPHFALVFSLLNAALLFWRIRVENAALAEAAALAPSPKSLANGAGRL